MKLPSLSKLFKKLLCEADADVVDFPMWRRKQRFSQPSKPGIEKGKILQFDPKVNSKELRAAETILKEVEGIMSQIGGYEIIGKPNNPGWLVVLKLKKKDRATGRINVGEGTPFQLLARQLLNKGYKSGQQGDVLYKQIPDGVIEIWRFDWIDQVAIKAPIATKDEQMKKGLDELIDKIFQSHK